MSAAYDGDGNRTFQLNYNVEAACGYGKEINGEVFLPENLEKEDGRLSGAGEVWSYVDSCTGRTYDLTEYVHDINRRYTETLMEERRNSGARDSYSYGMGRLSQNQIWEEARDVIRNEMNYYVYDGRGSVTGKTWWNGMVTEVYQYSPYGEVTLGGGKYQNFYGYNGESYNPNTGQEYLRNR